MILPGANELKKETDNTLYAASSEAAGQYFVFTPNNTDNKMNMLIDLHGKPIFDAVTNNTKTKDELITDLTNKYTEAKAKYPNGILIFPMLDEAEYNKAVNELDKQKMFDGTKKIGAITSELYKKITESGVGKDKIDQKIMIIENEEVDTKYVNWLKEQMPGFVEGVSLKQEEKIEEAPATVSNDIFGIAPAAAQPATEPTAPANEPEKVDIFGIPLSQEAAPVAAQPVQPTPAPVTNELPKEEPANEPTAVTSVPLEGTSLFNKIEAPKSETPEQPTAEPAAQEPKKSGGFVNLAILLVVLIVITIASVEFGKFLYKVFGA